MCASIHKHITALKYTNLVVKGDSEGPDPEAHAVDEGLSVEALAVALVYQIIWQLPCVRKGECESSINQQICLIN